MKNNKQFFINILVLWSIVGVVFMTSGCKECWKGICSRISSCCSKTSDISTTQTSSQKTGENPKI